jgi:hypothetical protein
MATILTLQNFELKFVLGTKYRGDGTGSLKLISTYGNGKGQMIIIQCYCDCHFKEN